MFKATYVRHVGLWSCGRLVRYWGLSDKSDSAQEVSTRWIEGAVEVAIDGGWSELCDLAGMQASGKTK